MAYRLVISWDLIAVCLCSSCWGGREIQGHITREVGEGTGAKRETTTKWWRDLAGGDRINEEGEGERLRDKGKKERTMGRDGVKGWERQKKWEKPYKTTFLPGECNSVMKKEEGGPRAHGPMIKLYEQGAREEKRREGGMEGKVWRTESNGTAERTPIKNKAVVEPKKERKKTHRRDWTIQ